MKIEQVQLWRVREWFRWRPFVLKGLKVRHVWPIYDSIALEVHWGYWKLSIVYRRKAV